jgi:hypothetical protein
VTGAGSFAGEEEFTASRGLKHLIVDIGGSIHTRTKERECTYDDRLEK